MRNKPIRKNFDRQGGGGVRKLYFNYTLAPWRASFPIKKDKCQIHMS